MLGRTRGGPPSTKPHAEGAAGLNVTGSATTALTGGGQEVTVSHFVAQLDEAARRRLDSMHQRLRLLEQQMEMLEAEDGKASTGTEDT
ncbi:hypothetical protein ACP70R_038047 [Stipagrostis hirtigluma subsp. patula]